MSLRSSLALSVNKLARAASRASGLGGGSMIGGLLALKVDPRLMERLAADRRTVLVTGTNGKSTTTRMVAAALESLGTVVTQPDGANMDAGIVAALCQDTRAGYAAIEVDELHLPNVARQVHPEAVVLLNLSRDQLDRVGEISSIERTLRQSLENSSATLIANCDDVMITSIAYDAPNVVWVAAGCAWRDDSALCPRSGEPIVREGEHWYSTGTDFSRPTPDWWFDGDTVYGPNGTQVPMTLQIPGDANRGNATQAIAAAVSLGASAEQATPRAASVGNIAGRYQRFDYEGRQVRLLLAKNPAGWQQALTMLEEDAVIVAVNGQVPDGVDLSWLWDVDFEDLAGHTVIASGERAADLSVRVMYAGIEHRTIDEPLRAITGHPMGPVDILANYTAFRDLSRDLRKAGAKEVSASA